MHSNTSSPAFAAFSAISFSSASCKHSRREDLSKKNISNYSLVKNLANQNLWNPLGNQVALRVCFCQYDPDH
jgi:ethanolamine ammonia-lyase small subunit